MGAAAQPSFAVGGDIRLGRVHAFARLAGSPRHPAVACMKSARRQ